MAAITHTDIWKFSIPIHPFTIATGTMSVAQNTFIRLHTDEGITGVGECSAFPMITGETQATCFEMAREFAALWKTKDPLDIAARLTELDHFAAFNTTIKSAFDMALYDIAAKRAGKPLYAYLGGSPREMETDLTIGIGDPELMARTAADYVNQGVRIIKIKLGKKVAEDIERVRLIRKAAGPDVKLRVDANQGWTFEESIKALTGIEPYFIEFCEQPMRQWNDEHLPALRNSTTVPLMADESVYDNHDASRLIDARATDFINLKFAKSGGIHESLRIMDVCISNNIPCMMGGMLESRVALSAFAHFACANTQIKFFDMDTCMLGHREDPVVGGVTFDNYFVKLPSTPGIGADADDAFLEHCEKITV